MKLFVLTLSLFLSSLGTPLRAEPATAVDKLRVVTTLPDLADIAKQIGGERVQVFSIAKGRENIHRVPARPSHMVALSKADLFVQIGFSLEVSFVPNLIEQCRNPRIQPGAGAAGLESPGFLDVSLGWQPIQIPSSLSRQGGDLHPGGNPHVNLAPNGGRHMADRILDGLVRVDPGSEDAYRQRHAAYLEKLEAAEKRWQTMGAAWKGRKIAFFHREFSYIAEAHGIEEAVMFEPMPGIPPSPGDVARAIRDMKEQSIDVILTAVWSNNNTVRRIAKATGAKIVELPNMSGGLPGTENWIDMMQLIHDRLADAFGTAQQN